MNTILYIGLALILIGFVGFIICEIRISQLDRHLFRQKQLDKSFKNADKTNERKYKNTY
jgi:phosphate/sulfate permease